METLINRPLAKKRRQMRYKARLKRQRINRRPLVLKHKRERLNRNVKIYRLHCNGLSVRKIASKFSVSTYTVSKAITGVRKNNHLVTTYHKSRGEQRTVNHYSIRITNDFKAGLAKFRNIKLAPVSYSPLNSDYQRELRLNHILKLRRRAYRKRMTGDD